MLNNFYGNCCQIYIEANESTSNRVNITLPDGYSFETIHITYVNNIIEISKYFSISSNQTYNMPPINAHSPCTLTLLLSDITKKAELRFIIEKFGQIPDTNYFSKAFEPILVTGDDGNEYNVIPSDQFK